MGAFSRVGPKNKYNFWALVFKLSTNFFHSGSTSKPSIAINSETIISNSELTI